MNGAPAIDLNVDFGETDNDSPTPAEFSILSKVSSINLSCGLHAGNPALLDSILGAAAALPIAVGAHPSYDDRAGFGRRETGIPAVAIEDLVAMQVATLRGLAQVHGVRIRYLKAHGALYHRTAHEADAAAALCRAAARGTGAGLPILGPAGSILEHTARQSGLPFFREAFLDRGYKSNGNLVPRGEPGDMVTDARIASARAIAIARGEPIEASDGMRITVAADSLCVHGDSPTALEQLTAVRFALREAGVTVSPFAP